MSLIDLQRRVDRLTVSALPTADGDALLSRLTPDQMMQAAHLRARLDEVGPDGLTDEEHAIADEIRAALLGENGVQL